MEENRVKVPPPSAPTLPVISEDPTPSSPVPGEPRQDSSGATPAGGPGASPIARRWGATSGQTHEEATGRRTSSDRRARTEAHVKEKDRESRKKTKFPVAL